MNGCIIIQRPSARTFAKKKHRNSLVFGVLHIKRHAGLRIEIQSETCARSGFVVYFRAQFIGLARGGYVRLNAAARPLRCEVVRGTTSPAC